MGKKGARSRNKDLRLFIFIILAVFVFSAIIFIQSDTFQQLTGFSIAGSPGFQCSFVNGSCPAGKTNVLEVSATSNAHAALPGASNYTTKICCSDSSNNITTTGVNFLDLSSTSNAHVEIPGAGTYPVDALANCSVDELDCSYLTVTGYCPAPSGCLATISGITNAHVADCVNNPYLITVCCQCGGKVPDAAAVNLNGSTVFTTDKQIIIRTFSPDIDILNFQLDFQALIGTFDTTTGTCSNCSYDLSNGTCQAEIEKIWAMFPSVNVSMTLSTNAPINMTALNMICRVFHSSLWPAGCSSLSPHGFGALNWMSWVGSSISTVIPTNAGVVINLTGSNIYPTRTIPLGTAAINNTVQQLGCEINGTWNIGDDQNFTINKTISIIAQ